MRMPISLTPGVENVDIWEQFGRIDAANAGQRAWLINISLDAWLSCKYRLGGIAGLWQDHEWNDCGEIKM